MHTDKEIKLILRWIKDNNLYLDVKTRVNKSDCMTVHFTSFLGESYKPKRMTVLDWIEKYLLNLHQMFKWRLLGFTLNKEWEQFCLKHFKKQWNKEIEHEKKMEDLLRESIRSYRSYNSNATDFSYLNTITIDND